MTEAGEKKKVASKESNVKSMPFATESFVPKTRNKYIWKAVHDSQRE